MRSMKSLKYFSVFVLLINFSCSKNKNWKTYKNEEDKFEISYPSKFSIKHELVGGYTAFCLKNEKETHVLSVSPLWKRDQSLNLMQFVHNDTGYGKTNLQYSEEKNIEINNAKVYKFTRLFGSGSEEHFFFLKDENSGINISYDSEDPHSREIEKMLSTFVFTD